MSILTAIKAGQAQQRAADLGTVTSIGGTAFAWLGPATEVLQFVVLLISAAAGIASTVYYIRKARAEKSK